MLNQRLQQRMLQKLSPQQILLMKLLQIPSLALEQRIKQEIEENPVLEISDEFGDETPPDTDNEPDDVPAGETATDDEGPDNDINLADYLDDDEIPAYKLNAGNQSPDDERREIPFAVSSSFQESLIAQLGLHSLTREDNIIAENIIGNLDDAGYLQRDLNAMVDDLAFTQNISTNRKEIERILQIVQELDPPGIAARNLQECLLLQLRRLGTVPGIKLAMLIIERYFDDFIRKHYDKIMKRSHCSEQDLREAVNIILSLNPKPGNAISEQGRDNQYIVPDFIIVNKDGELELTLNQRNMPELRLNRTYVDMLEAYGENKGRKSSGSQKEAVMFIKQKIDSAKWFIDAIKQRQHTLYVTMKAIMDYQYNYFLDGDETRLRPMILKDIAERVNLDISTISRVANSKYVQTPFGTFLLKSFFSEAIQNDQGEEISTREIKKILSDCIESEEKNNPLTDEELTAILKKKGYPIARRTVAKYREQLNIPVARLRRNI
ncbi:MAG TPA: RNA polymerase factor sigma-54 [Bacteroidales bacterium]|nr:RNA polymerase factor sigma-54 [Bacteroidales bacterium]HPT02672.1 RNA polymerase factor sigma-54 [Bacteroidales bacterium]